MSKRETVFHVSVGGVSPLSQQGATFKEHLQVPPIRACPCLPRALEGAELIIWDGAE